MLLAFVHFLFYSNLLCHQFVCLEEKMGKVKKINKRTFTSINHSCKIIGSGLSFSKIGQHLLDYLASLLFRHFISFNKKYFITPEIHLDYFRSIRKLTFTKSNYYFYRAWISGWLCTSSSQNLFTLSWKSIYTSG